MAVYASFRWLTRDTWVWEPFKGKEIWDAKMSEHLEITIVSTPKDKGKSSGGNVWFLRKKIWRLQSGAFPLYASFAGRYNGDVDWFTWKESTHGWIWWYLLRICRKWWSIELCGAKYLRRISGMYYSGVRRNKNKKECERIFVASHVIPKSHTDHVIRHEELRKGSNYEKSIN